MYKDRWHRARPGTRFPGRLPGHPAGELQLLADDFDQPNGLCFSPGGDKLYVNDTRAAISGSSTSRLTVIGSGIVGASYAYAVSSQAPRWCWWTPRSRAGPPRPERASSARGPHGWRTLDSQADSASSILVTRYTTKSQFSDSRWSLVSNPLMRRRRPRALDVLLAHGHDQAAGEARARADLHG